MKLRLSQSLALALSLVCSIGTAVAETPQERGLSISRTVDSFNNGYKSETSTMEMVLINAHGDRTTRKLKSQQIEVSGEGDRSRMEFLWPADIKGTRLLTWTHKTGTDDQWLYLPAMRRVKRISSGNKSGSFMGSEFAYEDLGSQEVEKYRHKFIANEQLNGRAVWKMERVPVDRESGYSRLVMWTDQQYMQPIKIEYFDRKSEILKTATFSGYAKFGNWYRAGKISMMNHQTKKRSELIWSDRKLGVKLRAKKFSSSDLGE